MRSLVMTGATSGIGLLAAEHILTDTDDRHLVVVARDPAALPTSLAPGERVTVVRADLADRGDIDAALSRIVGGLDDGTLPPLAGFVGNAALQYVDALHTTDTGMEATFAVNVLANHLFLAGLRDHLGAPSRSTITVSDTHFGDFRHNLGLVPAPLWSPPARLAQPAAFPRPRSARTGRRAYSTSKLAAIYLVHEWARRLPAGADIVSYNPGLVPGTGLLRNAGLVERTAGRWFLPIATAVGYSDRVAEAGIKLAQAILGRPPAPTGVYYDRGQVVPSSAESHDRDREAQLWDFLESVRTGPPTETHSSTQ